MFFLFSGGVTDAQGMRMQAALSSDVFIGHTGDTGPTPLDESRQHHHQHTGENHGGGFVAVVAVPDGEVTDAATSHQADHRRVGDERARW